MYRSCLLLLFATYFMLTNASMVCDVCECKNHHVNCKNRHLTVHFNITDWPNATDMRISEARFDDNQLVHITEFPVQGITYLSLSHNRITLIENGAFKNLQNLTELDLSFNYLTSIKLDPNIFEGKFRPEEYKPLHNLKILRLGNNALHSLNQDLFQHVPNLKVLALDSNPLKVIDLVTAIALDSLQALEVLDLAYTNLDDLPEYLLHTLRYLKVLNLTGNTMTRPPAALRYTQSLEELHFSDNPVTVLNEEVSISGLKYLRILHLSFMSNLTSIEAGGLKMLPSLQELYISHNKQLTKIDPNALSFRNGSEESEQWPPIKKLSLAYNRLGSLERHLLGHWDTLEYLNIAGNAWICDCENQWMISSLLPTVEKIKDYQINESVCVEPPEMRNRRLHDLEIRHYHLRCLDTKGNHPEKDAKILVGVLIGVLIAVPLTLVILVLIRRTGIGATLFARAQYGHSDYSKAIYSRADSVERF